ncbi:MAG: hypothetical protein AB7S26_00030 [Sandaracinaceae bacterium]
MARGTDAMMTRLALVLALSIVALAGCDAGDDSDAGVRVDAGARRDAGGESDAGASGDDAGARDAGASDAGAAEVEVFVAAGWGGRRIASCDLGRTWIADQQLAPQSDDDWHQPFTPKSLAFGDGHFVFLTGWGANSVARVSADGVTWEDHMMSTTYGAVGYADGRFVLVGNRNIAGSVDAASWMVLDSEPASTYDRAAGAFDGIWAAGADGAVETRIGSGDWEALGSCAGTRHGSIGLRGGFAAGGGVLVSVGDDGDVCARDIGTGADLGAGAIGEGVSGPPVYYDGAFHVASGSRIHTSSDGLTWTSEDVPSGMSIDLIAGAASGTEVGLSRDGGRFYYRDAGGAWTAGTGPSGNGLLYVAEGRVSPSASCPAL